MDLPIKFKYYTLDKGRVEPTRTGELGFDGYVLLDEYGIQLAAGTSLGGLIAHAHQADITMELAKQWVDRKLKGNMHLDKIDIDAAPDIPAGFSELMLPPHMQPPPKKH